MTIPVRYDGEDLAEFAALLGVTPDELVARHQAATWTVAFTGFAPGFGYLVGDDPLFDVPRRPSPRTRIPAGEGDGAGRFSGVYPSEVPLQFDKFALEGEGLPDHEIPMAAPAPVTEPLTIR